MHTAITSPDSAALRFAAGLRIYKLAQDHWQFVSLHSAFSIKCPEALLQTLQQAHGRHSRSVWLDAHQHLFPRQALEEFLQSLLARGILFEQAASPVQVTDSYFHAISNTRQNPDAAPFDPAAHPLCLHGNGVLQQQLRQLAQEAGFPLCSNAAEAALLLIVADSAQHDDFRAANRDLVLAHEKPAIFAWLDGSASRLLRVLPRATACFECLHHRMRAGKNFFREFDAASSGHALWHENPLPPARLQAQHMAAMVLMHATTMLAHQVLDLHDNHLLECNALRGTDKSAQVLKLPRCAVCGNGNTEQPFAPVYDFKGM